MNRRSFFTRFAGLVALVGVAKSLPASREIAAVGLVSIHTLFDRMRFYEELMRSAYLQPNDIKELEC